MEDNLKNYSSKGSPRKKEKVLNIRHWLKSLFLSILSTSEIGPSSLHALHACMCSAVGALDRWELWALPMLLNNLGTWTKRSKSTLDMLDELQHMIVNTCHTRPHLKISAQLALIWRMGHEWYYYPNSYPPTRHPATRPTALVENWDTSATTWEILL